MMHIRPGEVSALNLKGETVPNEFLLQMTQEDGCFVGPCLKEATRGGL